MTDPAPAPVMVAPAMAAQHSPAPLQPAPIIRQPKLEEAEIASSYAKIRFPEFDSEDVETWFVCLEAAFYVNNVASDKHKFNAVIVALGTRAKFFHAAIAKCNKSTLADRYSTIKKSVIDFFLPSENQRLTSLLSGVSLGDRKPSMLLSEMRRMGGEGCSDSILSNIWLRALPTTVRSIIAAMPSASLDHHASVADKILEAPSNAICTVNEIDTPAAACSLEARIDALSRRLDEVLTADRYSYADSNTHRNSRSRQRHPSSQPWGQRTSSAMRSRTPSRAPRRWICWFHYRHGNKAEKCEKEHSNDTNTKCIFFDEHLPVYSRKK